MKLNKKKHSAALYISYIMLCTLYFVLNTAASYSQEKTSVEITKSQVSSVIGGVKFLMHTVEKGQTLFAIAKCYGLSLNDIVIENPEAIDGIKPGEVLKIPIKKAKKIEQAAADPNSSNYILHKVEHGQTLYSLSKQYETSVESLTTLNPELKDGLKVGQTVKIPSSKPKKETSAASKPVLGPIEKKTFLAADSIAKFEAAVNQSTSVTAYSGKLKAEYNIAFFLPFHASEALAIDADKIIKGDAQLPNKTTVALQFYEGALLAIDSLKKQKLNAKIFVFDIDDSDSLSIVNILKKPELKKMDLMIGPLYGSSFMPVAKFAKDHSIAIVSPFTQINKILFDNLFVCKVLPSSTMQVEQMAHFAIDSFKTQNIIIVNNGNLKEVSFYNAFKNTANRSLLKAGYKAADSIKVVKSLGAIEGMLNSAKINVIALPSNNQSYVTEFISKLNTLKSKYKIVLFGLQTWISFDNLDFDYLNNLSLHIPSNNYIDYQNAATQNFIKNYREKFKTEPEMFAYQGFDITCYFLSSLQKYGSGFLGNIVENKYQGIETNFHFMQYPLDSGFENKFVYILKFQDYKLVKAN